MLCQQFLVYVVYRIDGIGTGNLSVVQHTLISIGEIFLREIRMVGHVHHNIRQGRRQKILSRRIALARIIHRRGQHLRKQIEADCRHVTALLSTQQTTSTADFQITHSHTHAASQICVLAERGKTSHRLFSKRDIVREQEIRIRLSGRTPDATFQLVHLS